MTPAASSLPRRRHARSGRRALHNHHRRGPQPTGTYAIEHHHLSESYTHAPKPLHNPCDHAQPNIDCLEASGPKANNKTRSDISRMSHVNIRFSRVPRPATDGQRTTQPTHSRYTGEQRHVRWIGDISITKNALFHLLYQIASL